MYTQTKLLYGCVKEESNILAEYIKYCGDKMIENFIFTPAKGGNWAKERLEKGLNVRSIHDQNMLSHINNGLFPTHDLINILEEKNIIHLTEQEKKVFTIAYCVHDIDKVWKQEIKSNDKESIDLLKQNLFDYCKSMNMDKFFPELEENIGNIAFLLINTQMNWGANLDDFYFNVTLNGKKLLIIRQLCTFSDKIAYLLKTPGDILNEGKSLNEILETLSNQTLCFSFHKVPEVRGLLTNVINNAFMKIYQQNGFIPYLFFPDGIIYLYENKKEYESFSVNTEELFETVKANLSRICSRKIKSNPPGFKFTNLSTTKNPQYYFDFINVEEYMDLVMNKAINPTGADPSKSMVQHFNKLSGIESKEYMYDPDERIGGLGRYLIFLDDAIATLLPNKDALYKIIFKILEIEDYKNSFLKLRESIENSGGLGKVSGGTKIEWFYIASKFIYEHKGCEFIQGDRSIKSYLEALNIEIIASFKDIISQSDNFKGVYLDSLYKYLENINLSYTSKIFHEELDRYTNSKKLKKPDSVCTVCNSSYPISAQEESSVPFQASVYKNKLSLHKSSSTGGICNICSLEFMLRQILIKGVKLTGSGFSDMKPKYFFVYPNYFFTLSTQKFVRQIFEHSKNINIFKMKQEFENGLKNYDSLEKVLKDKPLIKNFINSEENLLDLELTEKDTSFLKMEFPKDEVMTLIMNGMKGGDTDTESWAIPTLLTFYYFLLMNAKVVVTDSILPLYNSSSEIKETLVIDSPHQSIKNILKQQSFNIDEIYENLLKLMSFYSINIDVYAEGGKPNWNHLNEISREISTDLISIFGFLKKKQRNDKRDSLYENEAKNYIYYLKILGGEKEMGLISKVVDSYAEFYSAKDYSSYGLVRPVSLLADVILKADLKTLSTMEDDLKLMMTGELRRWTGSVISGNAKGYIKLKGNELNISLEKYTELFFNDVFKEYCDGDVSTLKSRLNRFSAGCEAYYVTNYKNKKTTEEEVQENA